MFFTYQIDGPAHALPEELDCVIGLNETTELGAIGSVFNVTAMITFPLGQCCLSPICGIQARKSRIGYSRIERFKVR